MRIIRGKISGAKKVVVYGPEGIGKSTFASQFPEPVFIDTEGSTKDLDVARFEPASSWTMLLNQVASVKAHPELCRTLVIDTADWAEMSCIAHVCAKYQKNGVEDFGYGKGYVYVQEEFGRLLNLLEEVVQNGTNVVMTAHAKMRKFEQPDEMGSYDRWEMKLTKQTAPMVKEWADMVLFANYKTFVVNVDGQGVQKGKNKAQGGKRVMYTAHHPCWDAKNRYGLPEELPFDYGEIAHIIEPASGSRTKQREEAAEPAAGQTIEQTTLQREKSKMQEASTNIQTEAAPEPELPPFMHQETMTTEQEVPPKPPKQEMDQPPANKEAPPASIPRSLPENIPKALRDLMEANGVDEWDIQNAVAYRGYFTADVPIEKYDVYEPGFTNAVLITAWDQVYGVIREMKEKEKIPF